MSYSEWMQDPDYTRNGVDADSSGVVTIAAAELVVPGALPPADSATLSQVVADSVEAWTSNPPTVNIANPGPVTGWVEFVGGAVGPWSATYKARRGYGLMAFSAYSSNVNLWTPPPPPAGAIGVQVEGGTNRASVVAATMDLGSTAYNWDYSANSALNGSWTTTIHVASGVTFSSATIPPGMNRDVVTDWDHVVTGPTVLTLPQAAHNSTRVDTLDLTPYLQGPPEAGYVALTGQVAGSATLGNPSASKPTYTFGAAYYQSTPIVYTLRPPRYRWIYSRKIATHQRVIQRGDGLGISGAPRAFGSSTRHASNRAFGIR